MEKTQYKVYFAGALFSHKDLTGNALLASYIERLSLEKYKIFLPQNREPNTNRRPEIRDQDLLLLFNCDVGLFNFDSPELDSGTVMEFAYAKMADIPSVQLRTDFRNSGDQTGGEPWNLMCSNYPRTNTLLINGMLEYHQAFVSTSIESTIEAYYTNLAKKVIEKLNDVISFNSLFQKDKQKAISLYSWARTTIGEGMKKLFSDDDIHNLVESKFKKGLI
ncbi:nucleoside 2-deoxyribosyltransferase [Histomonas meleagridis]|uniref:nucleoside 2-deoxyribosyltransferase n=1 Tax=Histomonas meleagridis TaxID=135588 RepID=UPI00355A2666|nr:nucleoside 2-deoxyribosyltransferase [Histomonas meleagridis]KAH0800088.1 nucleoside 2-deoxyribosyltransferase [Histomonas meleagridis]